MRWWKWKKRPVTAVRLMFEVSGETAIAVAEWPVSEACEERDRVAKQLAALTLALHPGNLLATAQQAIALAGRVKKDEQLAEHVLSLINRYLASYGRRPTSRKRAGNRPVVSPSGPMRKRGGSCPF